MPQKFKTLQTAEFNPAIRTYILVWVAFIMTVTIIGIPLLIVWFAGLGQFISRKYYENLKCELTERHLRFRKGALFKMEKTIPLENIQDLTFLENPLLNWLDLRVLKVETAGQSNPQGSDMKLIGIKDAAAFKDAVLDQREVLSDRHDKHEQLPQAADGDNVKIISLLSEIKSILTEIKNK